MAKVLVSPKGTQIRGTVERIPGVATIMPGTITQNSDGTFDFEYTGETDVFWDGQQTETEDEERLFEDVDGLQWRESELRLVDEEEVAEGEDE